MTYDLQIGVQRVWRRAVSSPRIMVWHFPSQICSVASVPTTSTRSCTVFFKASKFRPPNTVQRQNVVLKVPRWAPRPIYLLRIYLHENKFIIWPPCRTVSTGKMDDDLSLNDLKWMKFACLVSADISRHQLTHAIAYFERFAGNPPVLRSASIERCVWNPPVLRSASTEWRVRNPPVLCSASIERCVRNPPILRSASML